MQSYSSAAALVLALVAIGTPAQACRIPAPPDLNDVQHADAVVVGSIVNYRIVRDPIARRDRQRTLAKSPGMRPELRKLLEGQTNFLSDYARFDVVVDQVLVGEEREILSVTWDNSTFLEPETMPSGPFLIALHDPSASTLPDRDLGSLTVLQAPCSIAFMFESGSDEAGAIRGILDRRSGDGAVGAPNVR